MEYTREYWQPRIATNPNRFRKLNESNDYVELINEPEAITQAGKALTAARLNNMESGITGAVAGVNEIQGVVDLTIMLGAETALSLTPRKWSGITKLGNDFFACCGNSSSDTFEYIYKQAGGTGDFVQSGVTYKTWNSITTDGIDLFLATGSSSIYKKIGDGDAFIVGNAGSSIRAMCYGEGFFFLAGSKEIYKASSVVGTIEKIKICTLQKTLSNKIIYNNGFLYAGIAGTSSSFYSVNIETGEAIEVQIDAPVSSFSVLDGSTIIQDNLKNVYFIPFGSYIKQKLQTTNLYSAIIQKDNTLVGMVYDGDIYTATILTGNTYRASSSFTLPAMPDGARKRVLNTHATNAITVTAYSGTTIEGKATMTLSAGHEVELELIGTDWRKTGWNEKALLTYSQPVDCSSRVAEYTGDGIPLIPDNVAGRTYFQNEWATTDGWQGNTTYNTVSVEGGSLKVVYSGNHPGVTMSAYKLISNFNGKFVVIKVRSTVQISNVKYYDGSKYVAFTIWQLGNNSVLASGVINSSESLFFISVNNGIETPATAWYETIYVGTGAYDTPALDRAGNGNNLTLNAITPVNGKYGKAIKGNGSSAYAIASSPVIGATGTIAFYGTIPSADFMYIFDNRNVIDGGVNGVALLRASSTTLSFRACKADTSQYIFNIPVTASKKSVVVTFDGTNAIAYVDGVQVATTTLVVIPGTSNLNILRHVSNSGYSDSQIDRIRYDSRIWTADEARAWSLNPISIDSRV